MPKTQFLHGTVITPEFLAAINNPRYVAVPDVDGDIPFPLMSLDAASDINWLNGTILETFFGGLGLNPADLHQGGPISGAQLLAVLNALGPAQAPRIDTLNSLIALLALSRRPSPKLPIRVNQTFAGSVSTWSLGPVDGITKVPLASSSVLIDALEYKLATRLSPVASSASWQYQAQSSQASQSMASTLQIDIGLLVGRVDWMISQSSAGATRAPHLILRVLEALDFDLSFDLAMDVSQAGLSASQFDEISISILDNNQDSGVRLSFDKPNLFIAPAVTYWKVRVSRVNGVLFGGRSQFPKLL